MVVIYYCDLSVTNPGHSGEKVRENVSGCGLNLTVFVLSENYDVCFYIYWL